jgi:hypothetical protein
MRFPIYEKAEDIPESYHDRMKDMGLTDAQKVELMNNLQNIVQYFHDKAFGEGEFAHPDHDAAKYRAEQEAYYEALDKKTEAELRQDGYDYWMGKYGAYYRKAHGAEATEARARQHGEDSARSTLESRRHWYEFKEQLGQPSQEPPPKQSRKRKIA